MHGIVNKAISGMIIEKYGNEVWLKIKSASKIEDDYFLSDQSYPDEYTYKLVESSSEILSLSPEQILIAFGEYWILHTGKESFGELFKAAGHNVGEFLKNLPSFHNRVMLIYPKIKAPEFKVDFIDEHTYKIHYYSERSGLQPFVQGLLSGIIKMFDKKGEVQHMPNSSSKMEGEIFLVVIEH